MKYSIVTGYWSGAGWKGRDGDEKADFFNNIWWPNTKKYTNSQDIFVINPNSEILPNKFGKWIDLSFNLGHVHDLDHSTYYNKKFGGWSMSFIIGATLCYANDCDMIFKEQDCLAFGNWVEVMYEKLEKDGLFMLVGKPEDSNGQGLEQSLMIIKHEMLLPFVLQYLSLPHHDAGLGYLRPEAKFRKIINENFSKYVADLPFGYGRNRPKDFNEEIYYIQQVTDSDIQELRKVQLI